jgi:alpha-N-arabinofuranosidase
MDDLVTRHAEIMDRHDPDGRVGMIVDEWGVWHNVEPGTNPGFLYQQNTLRDALVAAVTFNIFHQHCERVKMANIAQTVNVLQAMVLTREEQMVLTPTYHVFEMYSVHQDATVLPATLEGGPAYVHGDERIPGVHCSASRDATGVVHLSLCNLDPSRPVDLRCELPGMNPGTVSGRVLTADAIQAHNRFGAPETVQPTAFTAFERTAGSELAVGLPPKSVVVLAVRPDV